MDPPHLLHWGLLLLALAAPRPNIAMSAVGPAEGKEDSSSGRINVSVYHCKDCESSTCNNGAKSFENFKIIAETQNKTSSDVITELVTNETHITICFEQADSCLEGIYGVMWEKAEGADSACGILNSGENGRGNTSTEKNVCCEAETNVWRPNRILKCYTRKSGPKLIALPVGIPEGVIGNAEFLTSKNNNIGIVFALLAVVVLAGCATTFYFLRQWRRRVFRQDRWVPDRENLTHV